MKCYRLYKIFFGFLIILFFSPTFALSEETYVFERMWPTLQQPWYFRAADITMDNNGFVYVADGGGFRILKFTSDGQFVTKWGSFGFLDGEFSGLDGITVDNNGFVYVVDAGNYRIQKFTSDGQFVTKWGSEGFGDGQFSMPSGIAVDSSGFVYVTDTDKHCVQKFTNEGQFVTKWGSEGFDDGQFSMPRGIAVDSNGFVYVAEQNNDRIQKFTSDGQFVTKWGSKGTGDGEFDFPQSIAVDRDGYIYVGNEIGYLGPDMGKRIQKFTSAGIFVAELKTSGSASGIVVDLNDNIYITNIDNIQKLTADGQVVTTWRSAGSENGEFFEPQGMVIDSNNYIYVADTRNSRIQKFTSDGQFVTKWGSGGAGGIAVDSNGYIYVAQWGSVQKFDTNGQFIAEWGSLGSGDGQFDNPAGRIAVDNNGFVYVADSFNYRVQKFTSDGQFVTKWGSKGTGDGEFDFPLGIIVDSNGFVFVSDYVNGRVQKFTSGGQFVTKWGNGGTGDGQLYSPSAIAVDTIGDVYVADYTGGIKKYTTNGQFITRFGEFGSDIGQLNNPQGLCIGTNGKIYVSEMGNNRVQVFKKVMLATNSKAIIVAGGGPFPGNNLWSATQMCANFAYRTLTYQGFTKGSIYYLTSDTDLDLDSNGVLDDVDADATNDNLENALKTWAAGAENLVVYLVDHGGSGTFRTSETEILSASDFASWLNTVQASISGTVTVIYDACESGSFLSALTTLPPPIEEKERIVITSTSPGEKAYFVTQGSISFSNYFWTQIFNGVNIQNAFNFAKNAILYTTDNQHSLLSDNPTGIALTTDIGSGTVIQGDAPVIDSVFPVQLISNTNSALLYADGVIDTDGIARVWAIIRPPDYAPGSSGNPVQEMPSIDLMPVGGSPGRFEATYNGFSIDGTYQIAIYARDRIGNTAVPTMTSVSVNNPLTRKAIIVAGSWNGDKLWLAVKNNVSLAYKALHFQGYSDDDIYLLSPAPIPGAVVDDEPTIANLAYAINTWAHQNTQDAVLYLVANGNQKTFGINQTENLSAGNLDVMLDDLQGSIPGRVTVIYDATRSGSFLSSLRPPDGKERILITSTSSDQPAHFISDGNISFSTFFWHQILNGANVRDAFIYAKRTMAALTQNQTPHLDDNGNGIGNEKTDGLLARYYAIGVQIMLAGDDPIIGSIISEQTVAVDGIATLWVDDVTTTGTIQKVWAVITPPGYSPNPSSPVTDELDTVDLGYVSGSKYQGTYNNFSINGTYQVDVYAMDTNGNVSMPKETTVCYVICSDDYEVDDTDTQANVININDADAQQHNFHVSGDEDWVKFYGISGETYTIEVYNVGAHCDAAVEIYDSNGTLLGQVDDLWAGEHLSGVHETLSLNPCPQDDVYYVRVIQVDSPFTAGDTGYDLKVYTPTGSDPLGLIKGTIMDKASGNPVEGAWITTSENISAMSNSNGSYIMSHPVPAGGSCTLTAEAIGYETAIYYNVPVASGTATTRTFELNADTDNDAIADDNDDDDDNDGMPDDWEILHSLDPLVDDASEDADDDGYTNLEEYEAGTDPQNPNSRPVKAMPWIPLLLLDE